MTGALLPAKLLDVRSREEFARSPTEGAANIPLAELRGRPFELPPKAASVTVADTGIEATGALDVVKQMGRKACLVRVRTIAPHPDRYRLWRATSMLDV